MKIAIGCDHHGLELKSALSNQMSAKGHLVDDVGTFDSDGVDYPDIAAIVGHRVSTGEVDRGILICGTGTGMSIVANKFAGVRAATCHDLKTAEMSRRHNDANVLCLSGIQVGVATNQAIVATWLEADFDGGRHQRRVEKIKRLEQQDDDRPLKTG